MQQDDLDNLVEVRTVGYDAARARAAIRALVRASLAAERARAARAEAGRAGKAKNRVGLPLTTRVGAVE